MKPLSKIVLYFDNEWGKGPILLIGSADTFDPCFVNLCSQAKGLQNYTKLPTIIPGVRSMGPSVSNKLTHSLLEVLQT